MKNKRLELSTKNSFAPGVFVRAVRFIKRYALLALPVAGFVLFPHAAAGAAPSADDFQASRVQAAEEKDQAKSRLVASGDLSDSRDKTEAKKETARPEEKAPAQAKDGKAAAGRQEVLEPGQFFGMASFGYASAKAHPEIMEKLFCYCGCDLTDKHNTLLDCFTSMHGVDCHICQEEAILALKMNKDGASMADIQKAVDEKYSHEYPFEQDTPNYRKYKDSRLYIKKAAGGQAAGPEAPNEPPATAHPTIKPGKTVSKCCEHGEKEKGAGDKGSKAGKDKSKKGK